MGNSDKWCLIPRNVKIIKAIVIIIAIVVMILGLLFSQFDVSDDVKVFFQGGGVWLSFMGFILMLLAGLTLSEKEGKIKVFVSIHATNIMFLVGVLCVFSGFLFQAWGIEKALFEERSGKTMDLPLWISSIATVIIAVFAVSNFNLAKAIKKTREKHDEETRNLFHAIAITNLIPSTKSYEEALTIFIEHHPQPTEIVNVEELKRYVPDKKLKKHNIT